MSPPQLSLDAHYVQNSEKQLRTLFNNFPRPWNRYEGNRQLPPLFCT
jgi:hypothetical protein